MITIAMGMIATVFQAGPPTSNMGSLCALAINHERSLRGLVSLCEYQHGHQSEECEDEWQNWFEHADSTCQLCARYNNYTPPFCPGGALPVVAPTPRDACVALAQLHEDLRMAVVACDAGFPVPSPWPDDCNKLRGWIRDTEDMFCISNCAQCPEVDPK